jgi:hypothetical protein
MKKVKLPKWLYTIFGVRHRTPKWETEFIANDNYFVQKLPRNCDVNSEISFHKHIVVDGKHEIEELNIKYELFKVKEDWFMKAYAKHIDGTERMHYMIK